MKKIVNIGMGLVAVSALTFGLTGCGGGSGSSSPSSGTGLSFPTNAVAAEPTIANGAAVQEVVVSNPSAMAPMIASVSSEKVNLVLLTDNLAAKISKNIKDANLNSYALNETVNMTENCPAGGTYTVAGSGSQGGDISLTMTYNHCDFGGGVVANGKASVSETDYDATADAYRNVSISFLSDFTETVSSMTVTIANGSTMSETVASFDIYGSPSVYTYAISYIVSMGNIRYGLKDCVFHMTSDSSTSSNSYYQTQGRIYINNLTSYVDYDISYDMSATPFVYNYSTLESGEGHYIMANNAKLKIVVESGAPVIYIDTNNDGTYDLNNSI